MSEWPALRTFDPALVRAFVSRPRTHLPDAIAWLSALLQLRACTAVGVRPRVWGRVVITNQGRITIGDRVRIRAVPWATELASLAGGQLEIGSGTFINGGVSISACKSVRIGSGCQIGPRVLIMDSDFHVPGQPGRRPAAEPVEIEDQVWIGAGATVLKGVRIGLCASIGAGSVVTHDVPAGSVVAGVPARPIASRPEAGT
jgi:acetyltransferase-like isoleucine patch superfamily enzyme